MFRLDKEQEAAATGYDRSIFLTAGAGAGKTRVLTERVKHILEETDDRVLAITFTNRAAEEMAARIESALEEIAPGRVTVMTIDGFCRHLLSLYDIEADTLEAMEQLNEGEARALLEWSFDEIAPRIFSDEMLLSLMEASDISPDGVKYGLVEAYDKYRTKGALHKISPRDEIGGEVLGEWLDFVERLAEAIGFGSSQVHQYLETTTVESLKTWSREEQLAYFENFPPIGRLAAAKGELNEEFKALKEKLGLLYEGENKPYIEAIDSALKYLDASYRKAKREKGAVDFQDLLEKATALLESGVAAPAYDHLLVDEFQDTNPLQIRLLKALKGESTLFIVGDKKQSIYGFRGADRLTSESFGEDMVKDGATSMSLVNNYRSHADLVALIKDYFDDLFGDDEVIGHGEGDWEFRGIDVGEGEDDEDSIRREALWIAEDIRKHPASSRALLLWRKKWMSVYEEVFREQGIRYRNRSSDGFYDAREVRDLVIALEAQAEENLSLAALRSPFVGSSREDLYRSEKGLPLGDDAHDRRSRFEEFLKERESLCSPYVFLKELIHWSGYYDSVFRKRGEQGVANVDAFLSLAESYEHEGHTIEGFLDKIKKDSEREKVGEAVFGGEADIDISTMHGAKGLEYERVYMGHLFAKERGEGGLFNYSEEYGVGIHRPDASAVYNLNREIQKAENRDEIRRLLYVAMTRAENYLYLIKSKESSSGLLSYLEGIEFKEEDVHEIPSTATKDDPAVPQEERKPIHLEKRKVVSASALLRKQEEEILAQGKGSGENYLAFGSLFHHYAQRATAPDEGLKARLLQRGKSLGVNGERLKVAMERYDKTLEEAEILGTEVPFSANFGKVTLEGFYDQLRILDGRVAIIDFKTGERGIGSHLIDQYRLQIGLYGKAYEAIKGEMPDLYLWTSADGDYHKIDITADEERGIEKLLANAGSVDNDRVDW